MTVEVNFSTATGFSYIVLRMGSNAPVTMEYQGPHEEKSDKYKVDAGKIYEKEGKVYDKQGQKILDATKNPDRVDAYKSYAGSAALMFRAKEIEEASKVKSRVGKVYGSFWGGVEIDGLHEDRMLKHWNEVDRTSAAFFKGSAFGWPTDHDRTSHSVMARLLAVGLPDRLKGRVSIGVKARWSAHDVQVYAEKIWHNLH